MRWLVAVQAQDYAGAKWGVGQRMPRATDQDVEQACAAGLILRTHLLRPTWHFVTPADIRWLLALTTPRVHATNAYMYRKLGLDAATLSRSDSALAKALAGSQAQTRDQLREVLTQAGIDTSGSLRMGYLMMHAELEGVVCSGPRRGRQFTYALLDEHVPPGRSLSRDEALAELACRYFESRGPATVDDFAKWSGLTVTDARAGADSSKHELTREVAGGETYWLSASPTAVSARAEPKAHLLSIYDEYISAYRNRSAMADAATGARLSALGNGLTHVVAVDGRVVGTWKPTIERRSADAVLDLFGRLTRAESRAVAGAVEKYRAFME